MVGNFDVEPRMEEVSLMLPHRVAEDVRALSRLYRTSFSGMVNIALSYYFGDGSDHLRCESCDLWRGYCMQDLEPGKQTTIPLLDKGMVVVGQPIDEQGF